MRNNIHSISIAVCFGLAISSCTSPDHDKQDALVADAVHRDSPTRVSPKTEECCTDPGAVSSCWWEDAVRDGVACVSDQDCPRNTECVKEGLPGTPSPVGAGLCACSAPSDCGSDGICVIPDGETEGLCGPSYCNGYRVCSCFGGCQDALLSDYETPAEWCDSLAGVGYCCEGTYPELPGTDSPGFCANTARCDQLGCLGDDECPDDGNPCTNAQCDLVTGRCEQIPVDGGTACDDQNACTENSTCNGAGSCGGGTAVDCADNNICTIDDCDEAEGCIHSDNDGVACDDEDECTIGDICSDGACESGADWTTIPGLCGVGNVCRQPTCDGVTGCGWDTASYDGDPCEDGDPCTESDVCASGTCMSGSPVSCDDGDDCTVDVCNTAGDCEHERMVDCCAADADCGDTCGVIGDDAACNRAVCDFGAVGFPTCVCDPTYGLDNGLPCTVTTDTFAFPENCFETDGRCGAIDTNGDGDLDLGVCERVPIAQAENNRCRGAFAGTDPTELDTTSVSYLGFISNSEEGEILAASGSTVCGRNSYEAAGINCADSGGGNLGHDGNDVVYAFDYQTNGPNQDQLYAYVIKVEANFDVGVYTMNNIQEADDCPEGTNDDPDGSHIVPSARCFKPYSGASTIIENTCLNGNAITSQTCCNANPFIAPDTSAAVPVTCAGTSGSLDDGYYWCRRYYPAGCCDYAEDEDCQSAPDCDGYWEYPADPYDCDFEKTGAFPYDHVATAIISPLGDTDASRRKAFIFIDGVGAESGNFHITVERREWAAGPCDRANDDARVYDVTNAGTGPTRNGLAGSTYAGNLESAVNSSHLQAGSCGGYDCANEWAGAGACHETITSPPNEFWPNHEWFKIDRPVGTGRQTYCFETDEQTGLMTDAVLVAEEMVDTDSICAGSSLATSCIHDDVRSGTALNNFTPGNGNIKVELDADEGKTYLVGLSGYAARTRPCGTAPGDKCHFALSVTEGSCFGYDCEITEDFEAYSDGDAIAGLGEDAGLSCGWSGPWRSWTSADMPAHVARVYDAPDLTAFKGVNFANAYAMTATRQLTVPGPPTHIYLSVRFMDLCRVTDPGETLNDGTGDCRNYGKTLFWSICPTGQAIEDIDGCLSMLYTSYRYNTSGTWETTNGQVRFKDAADNYASDYYTIQRPMVANGYADGAYATVLITENDASIWVGHKLTSGIPNALPDVTVPGISLNGHGLGDFTILKVYRDSGWGEGGAVTDDIHLRFLQE